MKYRQETRRCKQHDGCIAIYGVQDGREVTESHLPQEVPAGTRLNLDHPEAHDGNRIVKWELLDEDHAEIVLGNPHIVREHRRHVAYHAHRKNLIGIHDAAEAVGVSAEALYAEAEEKGWKGDEP